MNNSNFIIELSHISKAFGDKTVLDDVSLYVKKGEFVTILGPSGCGKTTLLRILAGFGKADEGEIKIGGLDITDVPPHERPVNTVFQRYALFPHLNVYDNIAFGLKLKKVKEDEIEARVRKALKMVGMTDYEWRDVNSLSGGQQQRVAIARAIINRPQVLLLDEPMSQLDPIASYEFLSIVRRLNEEFSITVIMSEHKADSIFPFIDKAVFLKEGKIEFVDNAHNICSEVIDDEIFENYLPAVTKIYNSLSVRYPSLIKLNTPLSIREGRRCLNTIHDDLIKISNGDVDSNNLDSSSLHHINKKYHSQEKSGILDKLPFTGNKDALIEMKGIYFAYERENLILKNVDFDLIKGDFLSLIGGNGVGKSTFLQLLVGILKPIKGKVKYRKGIKLAYVHQNPMIHFSKDNVKEEFLESIIESDLLIRNNQSLSKDNYEKLLKLSNDEFIESDILNGLKFDSIDFNFKELIEFFDITDLIDKHPYDCSGGEQQKIAIVKALLQNADVLVLDEPTKGLDPLSSKALAEILNSLRDNGLTIIMTSHDLDFVANNCKRCLMLFDKDIQIDDDPKVIFAENNFYTTFVNRMVKDYVPEIVTLDDLKDKWDLE